MKRIRDSIRGWRAGGGRPRAGWWVALGLGLLALAPAPAVANYSSGGNAGLCVPHTAADIASTEFQDDGADNPNSSGVGTISCGTVRLTSASPTSLYVDYYDASATDNISCTASATGWTGAFEWTENHTSSGTGSGFFHWNIPSGSVGYIHINCALPPIASGHLSLVSGFNLQ
jgi:hypothetical protein